MRWKQVTVGALDRISFGIVRIGPTLLLIVPTWNDDDWHESELTPAHVLHFLALARLVAVACTTSYRARPS